MANFPRPKMNNVIDSDPQIIKVDLDYTEFSSRPSAMPKSIKNSMSIKHVSAKD